jgi:CheY-like chemotaxis protein
MTNKGVCGGVLVVDDDADIREATQMVLENTGHRVITAADGQEALEMLRGGQSRPCLILLDLMMPVMDGFEFLEKVKEISTLQRVPIVVLTAKDLTDAERNTINQRTMLVLTKGAQPLSSLGSALSVMARRPLETIPEKVNAEEAH